MSAHGQRWGRHPANAAGLGRQRFPREIGIAVRLRHPSIVPLFDSGIVVSGRPGPLLRELVPRPPEPERESRNPAEVSELREWLNRLLESLSPEDRLTLELYIVDDLPAADIARVLGLSNAKAVYNRVYRSLEAMRLRLDNAGIAREDL